MNSILRRSTTVVTFICTLTLLLACAENAQAQTSCAQPPKRKQMQWFPGDGAPRDIVENADAVLKNGTTFAPGLVGQAFSLDGADDYVEIPFFPLPSSVSTLSFEAWIKPTNVSSGHIIDHASPGGSNGFLLALSGGQLRASFGANTANGVATIPANTYTHIAATYDGANIRLYVNGGLDSTTSATTPGSILRNSQNPLIGAGRTSGTAFGGQIDEVQFYQGVLTAAEVQTISSAGAAGKCKMGRALISEFRLSTPDRLNDEYIEIYNNSDSELVVQATDGGAGWAVVEEGLGGGARRLVTIPNGTHIPARGHYLAASEGGRYSLSNYGGPGQANADTTYRRDQCFSCSLTLTDANGDNSPDHRMDRVGFSNSSLFWREGNGISTIPVGYTRTTQYTYVRKMTGGVLQDTNDNANDFVLVSTEPATTGGVFGSPGPENLFSPVERNKTIKARALDPGVAATAAPNRARQATDTDGDGTTDTDVLKIRRSFTNLTKQPVTRLRFRVVDITTAPRTDNSKAELRVINSQNEIVNISAESGGGTKVVTGVTLEDLNDGLSVLKEGGLNSSLSFSLAQPLQPGESIDVNFWLRVVADGEFSFLLNVEAETPPAEFRGKRRRTGKTKN
jgi:hypothetical protein